MASILDITVSDRQGVGILHLAGAVDANTEKILEDKAGEVINGGAANIVLDLRGVSYMGSAGLRALHVIAGMFGGDQAVKFAHVKLLSPSEEVRKVLSTVGFDKYIDVCDDLDQAINAF